MPAFSALMWFSIFIASSTSTDWPASTASPSADEHLHDRALHRRADRAAPGATAGRAGAGTRRAPSASSAWRPPAGASGSQSFTEKRLPLTSTGTVRSSSGSASLGTVGGRGVGRGGCRRRSAASTSSSTHFVECVPAAKSGCESSATCAGIVVCDARDLELAQRAQHALARRLAVGGPHDELADEVVVVLRDGVALRVAAVPAHAGTAGQPQVR